MDKIVREVAVMEFGQLLNVNENEAQRDQSGKLEITFQSASDGGLLGSPTRRRPAGMTGKDIGGERDIHGGLQATSRPGRC